jgi:hypothetical protein
MARYCDCGAELIQQRGSGNWYCPNSPKKCTVWAKKFDRWGRVTQIKRVSIPRDKPLQIS